VVLSKKFSVKPVSLEKESISSFLFLHPNYFYVCEKDLVRLKVDPVKKVKSPSSLKQYNKAKRKNLAEIVSWVNENVSEASETGVDGHGEKVIPQEKLEIYLEQFKKIKITSLRGGGRKKRKSISPLDSPLDVPEIPSKPDPSDDDAPVRTRQYPPISHAKMSDKYSLKDSEFEFSNQSFLSVASSSSSLPTPRQIRARKRSEEEKEAEQVVRCNKKTLEKVARKEDSKKTADARKLASDELFRKIKDQPREVDVVDFTLPPKLFVASLRKRSETKQKRQSIFPKGNQPSEMYSISEKGSSDGSVSSTPSITVRSKRVKNVDFRYKPPYHD
jgi:hypothetical protein